MTARLAALLTVLGATASGVLIYVVRDGVTVADLQDAGIGDCPGMDAICPARRVLPDGGYEYARVRTRARDCRANDGGFVLRPLASGEYFRVDLCRKAAADTLTNDGDTADELHECACRGSSQCRVRLADGGTVNAPVGVTVGEGYPWALPALRANWDPGCVAKSCGAVARHGVADDSWPAGCPQ